MKKTYILSMLVGLCAIVTSAPAYAMDLSLNDAVEKIIAESHDLKKADANLQKAQATLDAANANRWFKLDGTVSYSNMVNVEKPFSSRAITLPPELGGMLSAELDGQSISFEMPDNMFTAGLSLTQPIYTFGKIGNAVKSVKSAIKMAESSSELTRRQVRYAAADLYWTARMMTSGQDPMYIFRRLTRFAVEDVGLADPNALQVAIAAWNAYERLGSPEGDLALTQLVIYLGTAPKSIGNYRAQKAAYAAARATGSLPPPKNILNAPTKMMRDLGYNAGYIYDPDTATGFSGQNCFPESMGRQRFYEPVERGFEREIKKRLEYWDTLRRKINSEKN